MPRPKAKVLRAVAERRKSGLGGGASFCPRRCKRPAPLLVDRSQGAAVKSRSGHFLFPVAAGAECRWIKASVFCEWDTGRRMCDLLGLVFGLDAGCYLRCNNTCVFHILDLIYAGNAFIQSIYRYICSAAVALPKPLEQRAGLLSTQCTVFHQNNTLTTLCYTGARVGGWGNQTLSNIMRTFTINCKCPHNFTQASECDLAQRDLSGIQYQRLPWSILRTVTVAVSFTYLPNNPLCVVNSCFCKYYWPFPGQHYQTYQHNKVLRSPTRTLATKKQLILSLSQ